jgi:hypothetical protein
MWIRIAFAMFLVSLAANGFWLFRSPDWFIIPAALAGWYLADLTSGIVHMYMDYHPCRPEAGMGALYFYTGSRESEDYIRLRDATLGKVNAFERLVFDFKNHHPRPLALGRRSLLRQIGSTVVVASLPFSLILNLANLLWPVPGWATAGAMTYLVGGTFAQYFHGTLHRDDNPGFVLLLRRLGLLMTPAAHQLHHDTLRRDFATNNGWSNPVLNHVFRLLRRRGMLQDAGLEPS